MKFAVSFMWGCGIELRPVQGKGVSKRRLYIYIYISILDMLLCKYSVLVKVNGVYTYIVLVV